MAPLRIGTFGAARITPAALLSPASKRPDVEVVAVAARDRSRAQAFADKRGIPRVLDSYEALITDDDIDAVYVPLPNSHHAEWVIAAVGAGKHVLCEKPFTANADEARSVTAAADARPDLVVMEAFHWRYHPLAQQMIDVIRSGEIGALVRVETAMCIPLLLLNDIRWKLDLAGGAMMDVGCYAVSMLRHLSGVEPTVRSARALLRSPGVDRRVDAEFDLGPGASGSITASMLSRSVLRIGAQVVGTRGHGQGPEPRRPAGRSLVHRHHERRSPPAPCSMADDQLRRSARRVRRRRSRRGACAHAAERQRGEHGRDRRRLPRRGGMTPRPARDG